MENKSPKSSSRATHLESLLILTAGLTVIGLVYEIYPLIIGCVVISLLGVFIPVFAKVIHLGWTWIGKIAGMVNGFLILAVLFYVVLTPLALVRRLFKRNAFHDRGEPSAFVDVKRTYQASDLENPW